MRRLYPVATTVTPILLGVFILTQAESASYVIVATIAIALGLLAGALFWWDMRRSPN